MFCSSFPESVLLKKSSRLRGTLPVKQDSVVNVSSSSFSWHHHLLNRIRIFFSAVFCSSFPESSFHLSCEARITKENIIWWVMFVSSSFLDDLWV